MIIHTVGMGAKYIDRNIKAIKETLLWLNLNKSYFWISRRILRIIFGSFLSTSRPFSTFRTPLSSCTVDNTGNIGQKSLKFFLLEDFYKIKKRLPYMHLWHKHKFLIYCHIGSIWLKFLKLFLLSYSNFDLKFEKKPFSGIFENS